MFSRGLFILKTLIALPAAVEKAHSILSVSKMTLLLGPLKTVIFKIAAAGRDSCKRRNNKNQANSTGFQKHIDVSTPDPNLRIHIIVPTRDKATLLETCIRSIIRFTAGFSYQITIIDNGSQMRETHELLTTLRQEHQFIRVMRIDEVFNYSKLNNAAVRSIDSDLLVFINNDIEIFRQGWLQELVSLTTIADVGAIGHKLIFPDETVQHFGIKMGLGFVAGHPFHGLSIKDHALSNYRTNTYEVTAATGACLAVKSADFLRVGGFDENLPVGYNDVDLCLRLRNEGLTVLMAPSISMIHHESQTRGAIKSLGSFKQAVFDTIYMTEKHGKLLAHDSLSSPFW
jgi:GT2 family glycosyltransferase